VTKLRLREWIVLAGTPLRLQRGLYFGEAANDG
jgi:hypothetical protein